MRKDVKKCTVLFRLNRKRKIVCIQNRVSVEKEFFGIYIKVGPDYGNNMLTNVRKRLHASIFEFTHSFTFVEIPIS